MSLAISRAPLPSLQPRTHPRFSPSARRASVRISALFGGGKKESKQDQPKGKQKLTEAQYAQLAQQARGTARDFFKNDTEEQRVEDYVSTDGPNVPFLPVLLGIVLALAVTVILVAKNA